MRSRRAAIALLSMLQVRLANRSFDDNSRLTTFWSGNNPSPTSLCVGSCSQLLLLPSHTATMHSLQERCYGHSLTAQEVVGAQLPVR